LPLTLRPTRALGFICGGILLAITFWSAYSTINAINAGKLRDFAEFLAGARALDLGTDLYSAGALGYIYPPLLAWLLIPLSRLTDHFAALIWMVLNLSLLLFTALIAARDALRRLSGTSQALLSPFSLLVAAAGLLLISDKVRADIAMGQCNLLIAALWLLILILMDRRPALAGLILGFTANIKYITLIAVPYFIVRRRYKAAGFSLLFTILWALLPAATLGFDTNTRYLAQAFGGLERMVSEDADIADSHERDPAQFKNARPGQAMARIAELSDIRSISISSAWSRLTHDPLTDPLTLALILGSFSLFVIAALLLYRTAGIPLITLPWNPPHPAHSSPLLIATEFSGLLATVLCFGPQTNPRHLVLLLPMFVLIAALLLIRSGTALPGGVSSPSSPSPLKSEISNLKSSSLSSSDPSAQCPVPRASSSPLLLLSCSIALFLALILPPGGERFEDAVNWWRAVGGISWALALCYLALLHHTCIASHPRPHAEACPPNRVSEPPLSRC
jgi:hypothetical protein